MLILHAGLIDGRFLLWGETPLPPTAPRPRRGRKTKASAAAALPFAAGAEAISTALQDVLPEFTPARSQPEPAVLWLPTIAGQPLASSPLIAEPPESVAEAAPAPWTITALALTPRQSLDVVAACLDRDTLAAGVMIGPTLAYWATALRLAGALVAREQFLPDLVRSGAVWRACWRPIISGIEAQRFRRLAQAMPPACRALAPTADQTPDRAPTALLTDFVALVVDVLVRTAVAGAMVALPGRRTSRRTPSFDSVHDQWLYVLQSPDGVMRGSDEELAQLAEQVRAWQRPVTLAADVPFRLCFRLEEPIVDGEADIQVPVDDTWQVRYLLQAQDDPSLLVPVSEVWAPRNRSARILQRGGFHPREYLLTALGQAAGLSPGIEASLRSATPSAFATDTTGAHQFLTGTAALLEQAGFGVLLPAWWTRKGTKQRLTVSAHVKSPPMQGAGGLSLEDLVQFDYQVALGDQVLSLRELEALARLKAPLVRVRGQWVQVSAEEIQAALDFWKKRGTGQARLRDVVRMALGVTATQDGLAVGRVTAAGWVGDFLAQLEGTAPLTELAPPAGFHGTLRPYQQRGYSWLAFLRRWGLGACLADDMGLGKTVQALALIQHDWTGKGRKPTLLICPMSVVGNWKKEAERFTPDLPVLIHHGQKRTRGGTFAREAKKHALVISSYSLLHRDLDLLQQVPWAGIILDEAQNIKNPETKQAQAARALAADFRIALTGTPVENHVGDLWSIWRFLNPGFLGNQAEFRRAFFYPIQIRHDAAAAERLKRLTGPFLLRRLKTDKAVIADLPDKQEMKVFCNLTREQATLYAAVVGELDRSLGGAEGIQRKGMILGALSKLKQVCNHPAQFLGDNSSIPGRSGKLARLTEMLDEVLQAGDRALVFTQFTEMGAIIQKHLQETFGREVLFLHGGTARKQRDRMVARFQEEADGPRVFLLSLKAGGTGLNLTAANHVFHFDRWWNPAVENQATDRAFRIGQQRSVQVHKFLCVGTLEEKIDEMIERKQEVATQVVGTGETWLTELSNDQLRDLLALRREALGE